MKNHIQEISVLLGMIFISNVSFALNNSPTSTPEREASRCSSTLRRCLDVAEIDSNECLDVGNGFGKCFGERVEDALQCIDDYTECMGGIESVVISPPLNGIPYYDIEDQGVKWLH